LQSGVARIAADGTGTWVSAATVSGDPKITQVAISAAPALSPDGSLLYVAVDNGTYGYLLALNSTTLALVNRVLLTDPSSGMDAMLFDGSSATPTVGPDGDVYFGVLENPFPNHQWSGMAAAICRRPRSPAALAGMTRPRLSQRRSFGAIKASRLTCS